MGWAKFDDQFTDHPKVLMAGPWGELLYMRGVIYCARYETDGHIIGGMLAKLGLNIPAAKKKAAALVDIGLWHGPGHDCPKCPDVADGWYVHDYLTYNPSKEDRQADREIARRRHAMSNNPQLAKALKARDQSMCRYCGVKVSWSDRKSDRGGTYDHIVPVAQGGDESVSNLVVACRACNTKKGARTPEQAGMTLLGPPEPPPGKSGSHPDVTNEESGHPSPAPPDVPNGTLGAVPPVDKPKTWDPAWRAVEQYVSRWGALDPDRPPVPDWMAETLRPIGGLEAVRQGEVNKYDFRDAWKEAA